MHVIIFGIIFAVICSVIAYHKGRNAVGWFFLGFFFGLFALIVVLIVSNLKEAREREEALRREQQRLRERLKQEQIKSDRFREYAQQRLDNHDQLLGVDTKTPQALAAGAQAPALPEAAPPPIGAGDGENGWFFMMNGQRHGPLPRKILERLFGIGDLHPDADIWHESLEDWKPAREIFGAGQESL